MPETDAKKRLLFPLRDRTSTMRVMVKKKANGATAPAINYAKLRMRYSLPPKASPSEKIVDWAKSLQDAVSRCYLVRKNGIWQLFVVSKSEGRDRAVSKALADLLVQMNQKEGVQLVGRYISLEGEVELKGQLGKRAEASKIWC